MIQNALFARFTLQLNGALRDEVGSDSMKSIQQDTVYRFRIRKENFTTLLFLRTCSLYSINEYRLVI